MTSAHQQTFALPAQDSTAHGQNVLTEACIKQALHQWTAAIETLDPQTVANLYAENAVLWGTIAGQRIDDRPGIRKYFQTLLGDKNGAKIVLGAPPAINIVGPVAWAVSDYDFVFERNDSTKFIMPARYTFISQQTANEGLKIAHQHSSDNPEFPIRELG